MPTRYLLDTDICSYLYRREPPALVARFDKLLPGDAAISVITYGELMYGAMRSAQRERGLLGINRLLTLIPVLPMPENAGETYGAIRAALEDRGEPIGGNDVWIAAHAMASNLILVTNNEREFKRVPGLKFENWAK
jgi:tRNA(fMet)-specific endonuclease VapC